MTDASCNTDLYAWTRAQVTALWDKRWKALDIEHLAEEIESLGGEQEHAVESHLNVPSAPSPQVALPTDTARPKLMD